MTTLYANPLKAGDVVARRYLILRHLRDEPGGGVWLAQDRTLGIDVGLKFMPRRGPQYETVREAMRREAALALKLRHPNILQVMHYDEGDEGAYLIQEPCQGESLLAHLNRLERFRLPEALDLLEQVALALALAHRHHEVHHSFSPFNILVEDHTAKLTNFACPVLEEEEPRVTRLELKAYVAPETLQGEALSPAANVFSLGVLGFRLAAGSLPYQLTFDEPMPYRLEDIPVDLGEIPIPLQNLLLQCLAPDPRDRFEDAGAFLQALEQRRESWRTPSSVRWFGRTTEKRAEPGGLSASISRAWSRFRAGSQGTATRLSEGLKNLKESGQSGMARRLLFGVAVGVLLLIALVWGGRALFQRTESPPPSPPPTAVPPAPGDAGLKLPPAGGPPLSAAVEPVPPPRLSGVPAQSPAPPPPPAKPAKTSPPAAKEAYQVVVATYRNLEDAKVLKNKLQSRGIPVRVFRRTSGNSTYYLVKAGPFSGKSQAEEVARRLKSQERLTQNPQVVKMPAEPAKPQKSRSSRTSR